MSSSLVALEHVRPVHPEPVAVRQRRRHPFPRLLDPLAIAVLTAGISAAGASRPSLWFDEAATISAATRSTPELWRLLGHIDAVHGLYYFLMHGWFSIFSVTEFSSRATSVIAVGVAAAGVVVLARQFTGRSVAVCAGIAFAILPRVTWAGVEARSYALSVMAAVWLTVLLVSALRRNRAWSWLLYAVLLPTAVVLNAFVVLLIGVHLAVLAVLVPRWSQVTWWAASTSIGAGLVTPFLAFTRTEFAQVAWISPLNGDSVVEVLQNQYFDGSTPFAILVGVILTTALVLRMTGATAAMAGNGRLVLVAGAWILLPTVALLLYTVFVAPIYYPRYLCFTAPAVALLLGVCIVELARTPRRTAAVLLALTVAAAPNYVLGQRGPYKKEGMDYSQIADVVTSHARPGDCLLLDNTTAWKPGPIRPLLAARPDAYRTLVDLGRGRLATATNRLWDGFVPVWLVQDRLRRCTVLWTVSERDATLSDHETGTAMAPGPRLGAAPVHRVASRLDFRIVERWQFNFAQITESIR